MSEQAICTCKIDWTETAGVFTPYIQKCVLCQRAPKLQKENERLRAIMQPRTMEARMAAVWDVAEKYGHPAHSCRDAITFLDKYIAELLTENERLKAEFMQDSTAQEELDKLLEYARKVEGSRDVHSVYEVLDRIPALREQKAAIGSSIFELHSMMVANPLQADDALTFSEALHELRVAAEKWRAVYVTMLEALRVAE